MSQPTANFGMRSLILVVVLTSLTLGFLGREVRRIHNERALLSRLTCRYSRRETGNIPRKMAAWLIEADAGEITHLRIKHCDSNVLKELRALRSLRSLDLGGAGMRDEHIPLLNQIPTLKAVRFENTALTDAGVAQLDLDIDEINLAHTLVTDQVQFSLLRFSKLKRLDLRGTRVSDVSLEVIAALDQLECLCLSQYVSDDGISHLRSHQKLKWLDLSGTRITDAGLSIVATMPALSSLGLAETSVSDGGLLMLAEQQISAIDLSGCSRVTDDGVLSLLADHDLKSLDISFCPRISTRVVGPLCRETRLHALNVNATRIGSVETSTIKRKLPKCNLSHAIGASLLPDVFEFSEERVSQSRAF